MPTPDDRMLSHPHLFTRRHMFTRRAVLVGGVALVLAGCVPDDDPGEGRENASGARRGRPAPSAVPADALPQVASLAGAPLVYEVTGEPASFPIEPAFAERLDACLSRHAEAADWGTPGAVSTYGTWRSTSDGERPTSWHQEGRAFDLARVTAQDGSELVSCRYDLWSGLPEGSPERAAHERAYWRVAAALHRDFAYVLTYLYDAAHHNHIHVDNALSGEGRSSFRPGSWVQVHAVQAMCRHVWGRDTPITGDWDAQTREHVAGVLEEIGVRSDSEGLFGGGVGGLFGGGSLDDEEWHAFLEATAAHER